MNKREREDSEVAVCIGIDWADEEHAVCLQEEGSRKVERFTIEQKPEALSAWVNSLRKRFGDQKVAITLSATPGWIDPRFAKL